VIALLCDPLALAAVRRMTTHMLTSGPDANGLCTRAGVSWAPRWALTVLAEITECG